MELMQMKLFAGLDFQQNTLQERFIQQDPDTLEAHLEDQILNIEKEISVLSDKLSRLHVQQQRVQDFLPDRFEKMHVDNTSTIYRLILSDPQTMAHPQAPNIIARWIHNMPYSHMLVHIKKEDLLNPQQDRIPVYLGIGMLKRYFDACGEVFEEPMICSRGTTVAAASLCIHSLESVTREEMQPFMDGLLENSYPLLGDIYGLVVFHNFHNGMQNYYVSLHTVI
jgi:hypothetical protein